MSDKNQMDCYYAQGGLIGEAIRKEQKESSLAGAHGSATRWAAIGDTIETTLHDGRKIVSDVPNSLVCATANQLIASGRWRVSPNDQALPRGGAEMTSNETQS